MNKSVDNYYLEGCGRCSLGGTPECKVHTWASELEFLRKLVHSCTLTEESKWGTPCFTHQNKNILMISALKEYCCISFFKGVLLSDSKNLLSKPGPNSQAVKLFKFTGLQDIQQLENEIRAYIYEAIEIEKKGLKVPYKKNPEDLPAELEAIFEEDPILKSAFESLTPGRQRGYILHFSQPIQEKTRISRIEKCIPMILTGIGLNDKYKSMKN